MTVIYTVQNNDYVHDHMRQLERTKSMTTTRRTFLQSTAALAATSLLAQNAHAQVGADRELKIGLIGCGGRGTGAAGQALKADRNVKLWAMADAFDDRLQSSLARLSNDREIAGKIEVPQERRFTGFDGYQRVIECCDVVLLCTPPHFRPIHMRAAVQANKHVFAEKPCAVDALGVRSVLETCQEARRRNLSVVSGLCLRFDNGFRDTVRRIHDYQIGDVVALQANDLRGPIWRREREENMSDMTWQMRNWYYYTWLSGDFNVEQHVHFLDVCAWIMRDTYPVRAYGTGGRQVRTGAEFGHIYDHFSIVYEYENGVRLFSTCRQQQGCRNDMSAQVLGSGGTALITERRNGLVLKNRGGTHVYQGPANEMYQEEHNALFASIRNGTPINNGEYMAKSTLLAIMGRMAAYTGQMITWEQALNSREDLSPAGYTFDSRPPASSVAMPGVTRFV
jgi:predicted dehydrogenase